MKKNIIEAFTSLRLPSKLLQSLAHITKVLLEEPLLLLYESTLQTTEACAAPGGVYTRDCAPPGGVYATGACAASGVSCEIIWCFNGYGGWA
jgi:hypothetical protein